MYKVDKSNRMISLVAGTAMAGALLSGCASNAAPRAEVSASAAQEALAEGRHDGAVGHAEAAVLAEPRNASYRAMLANAYLDAGRFASAQTSFDDAMSLGDNSPRTALSLALSLTAQAKYAEASALLNDWESEIATADLGLALALAGQAERGIHLMSNAIRGGQNNTKMRQNLAYAYAIAGRWREARLMAAEDVPAGLVGERMAHWAQMNNPTSYQLRVADLLGVPSGVGDNGQPAQLALANHPNIDQLASEASAYVAANEAPAIAPVAELSAVTAVAAAPAVQSISVPASGRELPSVGDPQIALNRYDAPATERPTQFAQAFATPAPAGGSLAQVAQDAMRFANEPVVQSAPMRFGAAPEAAASAAASAGTRPVAQRNIANATPVAPAPASTTPASAAWTANPVPRVSGQANAAETPAAQAAPVRAAPVRSTPAAFRAASNTPASDASHLVQLGSFSSEQGARRAWGIYVSRYPDLAGHEMVISEAVVRGKRYFRVSAGGYDRSASRAMCGRVNSSSGEGCISWAAASPLPGAVETGVRMARR